MNYVRDLFKIYFIIFLTKTMSDSDKWASQVINEIIEEIATFDRIADVNNGSVGILWQNRNTEDAFINQDSKPEHTAEDSGTYRDYITGSPCKFEEEFVLSRSTNDFSAVNDVHSDDSLELSHEKNRHFMSSFTETNSVIPDEVGNIMDVFNDDTKISSGQVADNADSTQNNDMKELSVFDVSDQSNLLLTHTTEVNDDQSKGEECSNKKTDEKNLFVSTNLVTETGSPDEYLKRIDQKVRSLGFKYQHEQDEEPERSSLLTGSYFKYFEENYIKEEMDYRWRFPSKSHSDEKTDTNLPLESNTPKKSDNLDFKHVQEENANEIERKGSENEELDKEKEVINHEKDIKRNSIAFRPFKRKNRNILEEIDSEFENLYSDSGWRNFESTQTELSTEYSLNNKPENNVLSLEADDNARNINHEKRTVRYAPQRCNCILPTGNFSTKFLGRKRRKLDHDEEVDLVITKRVDNIIAIYRTACRVFEELFLRPSATIIVESIEFCLFLFFLGVCLLCIIYKEASFKSLRKKKDSFIDMSKRKNQVLKSSFSKLFLLKENLVSRGEMNKNLFKNDTPLVNFSPKIQSTDTSGNKNELMVEPDDVLVLNSVFEQVKQNLEDMYEKGDNYCESLKEEHRFATISSSEEDFVDIILKECTRVIEEPNSNTSELKMEGIPSSKATCCTELGSNESITDKLCNYPRTLMNTFYDGKLSHCSRLREKTISTESLMKEFNIDSDRMKGYVLNSTVIEDTDIVTKSKSRNRSKFRLLSPSNKCMSESESMNSPTSTSLCMRNYSSSSMSVNLPSFRSRSLLNLTPESPSLLDASEKVSLHNTCSDDTMLKELHMINEKAIQPPVIPMKSTDVSGLGHNTASTSNAAFPCMKLAEQQCSGSTENYAAQTSQNVLNISPSKSNSSDDFATFENAGMADDLQSCSRQCGNLFSYDNPDFHSELSTANNSNNEEDSLVMHETSDMCEGKIPKGSKSSVKLRRRMSLILNNWRNTSVMQCVTSNLKSRKKYKKQLDIVET